MWTFLVGWPFFVPGTRPMPEVRYAGADSEVRRVDRPPSTLLEVPPQEVVRQEKWPPKTGVSLWGKIDKIYEIN